MKKNNKVTFALRNIICGIILGISNVIPGVSGGTMAVVMNIYDDILDAISIKKFVKHLFFLVTLVIGVAVGIVFFSKLIKLLFASYPAQTNFFFMGLIIGSIPLIYKKGTETSKLRPINIIPFVLALALMIALFIMDQNTSGTLTITVPLSIGQWILLLVAGAMASFAMIIPGISGSMIMVIIGTYATVISACADPFNSTNIAILIPVGIGMLGGLIGGIKLVKVLIAKAPQATYMAILGLIIGSFLSLWPKEAASLDAIGIISSIVVFAVGFVIAFLFGRSTKEDDAKAAHDAE